MEEATYACRGSSLEGAPVILHLSSNYCQGLSEYEYEREENQALQQRIKDLEVRAFSIIYISFGLYFLLQQQAMKAESDRDEVATAANSLRATVAALKSESQLLKSHHELSPTSSRRDGDLSSHLKRDAEMSTALRQENYRSFFLTFEFLLFSSLLFSSLLFSSLLFSSLLFSSLLFSSLLFSSLLFSPNSCLEK